MKKKKNVFISLFLIVSVSFIILSGCRDKTLNNIRQEYSTLEKVSIEFSLYEIPFLSGISYQDEFFHTDFSLVIRNLIDNEITHEVSNLPDSPVIKALNDHYFAAFFMGFHGTSFNDEGLWFHLINSDERTQKLPSTIKIYNKNLEIINEFYVTDLSLISSIRTIGVRFSIIYDSDDLHILYLHQNSIYIYNVLTNKTEKIFQAENGLRIDDFLFVDDKIISFIGRKSQTEYMYFGLIDLKTFEVNYHQTEFPRAFMSIHGNHILIAEDWNEQRNYLNQVITLDLETLQYKRIQVGIGESLYGNVNIIGDQYVLTATHEYIRVYCMKNGQQLLNRSIFIDSELLNKMYILPPNFITIKEDSVYAVVFDLLDLSLDKPRIASNRILHTEIIIID